MAGRGRAVYRLHHLVGNAAAAPDAGEAAAECGGEKRARLLLGVDAGAFGPDAIDFAGFYSAAGDMAVDAAGSGAGCSFAFGVDTGY